MDTNAYNKPKVLRVKKSHKQLIIASGYIISCFQFKNNFMKYLLIILLFLSSCSTEINWRVKNIDRNFIGRRQLPTGFKSGDTVLLDDGYKYILINPIDTID